MNNNMTRDEKRFIRRDIISFFLLRINPFPALSLSEIKKLTRQYERENYKQELKVY
jgi:hypothetical protein